MAEHRPWRVVAPWYYWQRQIDAGVAANPRATRPAFQKFDQPDFVEGFLKQPQHSLKFDEQVDQVFAVNFVSAKLTGGPFSGKSASLYPADADGNPGNPTTTTLVPQGLRKLFLDTHKRYYLVVCELHCDAPGFPSAAASEVCQAGMVIRRRLLSYDPAVQKPALNILREIVAVEAQISELDQSTPLKPSAAQKRASKVATMRADGTFGPQRQALSEKLAAKRAELHSWKDDNGVLSIQEGWVPSAFDRVGDWHAVEDTPQDVTEAYFPLYPLAANPDIPNHDAVGRSLFFGVLPTSSLDTDARGKARFDDKTTYEVRCFLRRHKPECPRTQEVPDCHGEVFWSLPTELYRLASQFDLEGTSNRPVTIHLPNLAELAAQVATKPFGRFSPMKFVQPQSLKPSISGTSLSGGSMGAGQICFFAIPLITLVAFFVLQLFLPIIVFLFGLWFLLVLKFCIPPSFSIDAGLQAELSALAPKLDVELDASFTVAVGPPLSGNRDALQIHADLVSNLSSTIGSVEQGPSPNLGGYANSPLRALASAYSAKSQLPGDDDSVQLGLDLTGSLEFEARVTQPMVIS